MLVGLIRPPICMDVNLAQNVRENIEQPTQSRIIPVLFLLVQKQLSVMIVVIQKKYLKEHGMRFEMSNWQIKIWGKTRCLVDNSFYSEHELHLETGGICSCHYHQHRANLFCVESGIVKIVWAFAWGMSSKILTPGNTHVVPSLVTHQFQCIKQGTMKEVYFPDRGGVVSNSDIIRLTQGVKIDFDLEENLGIIKSDGQYWEISD